MNRNEVHEAHSHQAHGRSSVLLLINTESIQLLSSISQYFQYCFPDGKKTEHFMFKQSLHFDPKNTHWRKKKPTNIFPVDRKFYQKLPTLPRSHLHNIIWFCVKRNPEAPLLTVF